ncbi:CobD/CbiB family cobalamin biosynthesis protein [Mycolicibacterium elephantis]|uniref:CobD/CbiB family cobalamin biosynthesis protein n=1 Tax=Mycolicibacterium elephantis TaxID=81858 RepID=UPI003A88CA6E
MGLAAGAIADGLLGDPRRGHPVALFGRGAAALERVTYGDSRAAGALHTGALLAVLGALGLAADRVGADDDGEFMLQLGDQLLDPAVLDSSGLTRAAVESVAENTSDAQVAPLWWAAVGGVPAALVYRGANTLDAMIGNRSPRYVRFGWAAARFDDVINYVPARVTAMLVAVCAPLVGGSPVAALRAWRRDAGRHPSPNAGVVEAAFAGALGVRLGGPTQYAHQLEIRPTLGEGPSPRVHDLARAVRLSRAVQVAAAVIACAVTAAGRNGRRACPRC